jgi:hypothetical protein
MEAAAQLVREHGLMTLAPAGDFPSLAQALAGESIPSKWWSHPRANEIYNAFIATASDPEVLVTKLIDGKVTLIDRKLWPYLLRLAEDETWRNRQLKKLSVSARRLFDLVDSSGTIRMDFVAPEWLGGRPALRKDRATLERLSLVLSHDEHTESGAHEAVLESWRHFRERSKTHVSSDLDLTTAAMQLRPWLRGKRSVFD